MRAGDMGVPPSRVRGQRLRGQAYSLSQEMSFCSEPRALFLGEWHFSGGAVKIKSQDTEPLACLVNTLDFSVVLMLITWYLGLGWFIPLRC